MADPQSILSGAQVPDTVRADGWQAYRDATSTADLATRLNTIPLPQETKAALWQAKKMESSAPPSPGPWASGYVPPPPDRRALTVANFKDAFSSQNLTKDLHPITSPNAGPITSYANSALNKFGDAADAALGGHPLDALGSAAEGYLQAYAPTMMEGMANGLNAAITGSTLKGFLTRLAGGAATGEGTRKIVKWGTGSDAAADVAGVIAGGYAMHSPEMIKGWLGKIPKTVNSPFDFLRWIGEQKDPVSNTLKESLFPQGGWTGNAPPGGSLRPVPTGASPATWTGSPQPQFPPPPGPLTNTLDARAANLTPSWEPYRPPPQGTGMPPPPAPPLGPLDSTLDSRAATGVAGVPGPIPQGTGIPARGTPLDNTLDQRATTSTPTANGVPPPPLPPSMAGALWTSSTVTGAPPYMDADITPEQSKQNFEEFTGSKAQKAAEKAGTLEAVQPNKPVVVKSPTARTSKSAALFGPQGAPAPTQAELLQQQPSGAPGTATTLEDQLRASLPPEVAAQVPPAAAAPAATGDTGQLFGGGLLKKSEDLVRNSTDQNAQEIGERALEIGLRNTVAKNQTIGKYLANNNMTGDKWRALSMDEKNKWIDRVNEDKWKSLPDAERKRYSNKNGTMKSNFGYKYFGADYDPSAEPIKQGRHPEAGAAHVEDELRRINGEPPRTSGPPPLFSPGPVPPVQ